MFFQKQDFYIWIKSKSRPASDKRNEESQEKIVLKRVEAWLKWGDFT